ncbi:MAG: SIMPL domain-containing protein [Dysgonamonadaceae bacterium]|jgi:hypothetical protein|nr:SIMPL domain-containing protein [Dysgonamonadaceae bacterium]
MKAFNLEKIVLGLCTALGLIILGISINKGLQSFSNKERVVTVKGLAEKEIKAISSRISIGYTFSGDEPKSLVEKIDARTNAILSGLKDKGITNASVSDLNLYDTKTYYQIKWINGKQVKEKVDRYHASKTIMFDIKDVESTDKISNDINIYLINKNLTAEFSIDYSFPELNTIKPELIAESTKNAREAGEQFAKDSKSKLGKIKTATQGQISIANRYSDESGVTSIPAEPYMQKARVVSTIVFFLED